MELNKFKEYIYEGNVEGIAYLLNQNPQYLNSNLGGNRPAGPLHHVAMASHVSENKKKRITQLLIDKGATIEIKNDVGATPLLTSVVFNNLDVFRVLMENNANLRATNNNGENCLHAAFTHEGLELAEEIFSYKSLLYSHIHSLLHQKDNYGRIPVHVNCNRRRVMEIIQENLTLCKKYQEGFCKYRSSCKFLHFHADPPGIFYDNKNNNKSNNNNNNNNNNTPITTTPTTTSTNTNNNNNNNNNNNTSTTTTNITNTTNNNNTDNKNNTNNNNNNNNSNNSNNTNKVLCRHYQAGFCKLNNCKFLHISPEVHSEADQIISIIVLFSLKQIENVVLTTDILLALAGSIQQVQEYLVRQNMKLKELMIKYKELFKFPITSPHLCTVNIIPAYSFLKRIHPDVKHKLSAPLAQELEKSLRSQLDTPATKKEDKEDLKRRVFNRTGGYCYLCKPLNPVPLVYENYGQRNKPGSWDFEHIKPKSRFPELDDTDNLLPAHMDCNYKKSYHELESMIGEFDILTIVLDHPSINPKALADLNKYKEVMNNKEKAPPIRSENREEHKAWVVKSEAREIIREEQKEKIDTRETQKTENEKQRLGPKDSRFWDEHNMNVINYSDITIDKQLGRGTFSDVFRGTWKFEQVAIKKLFDNNDTESFQNEALSIAKNNSSHIVRMVGVSLDPLALVLEYLPGGSLSDLLKNTKEYASVSTSARIQFVIDIAIGLYHVHSRKIIHRDLKPANILLSEDKKHCKLSDFGVAKTTDRTISGSVKGTHLYLAPEAYKYTFNFYTDVYAFGICMHQILTGESPYH